MSKRYEQFMSLDREEKSKTTVVPPTASMPGQSASEEKTSPGTAVTRLSILILCVIVVTLGVVLSVVFLVDNPEKVQQAVNRKRAKEERERLARERSRTEQVESRVPAGPVSEPPGPQGDARVMSVETYIEPDGTKADEQPAQPVHTDPDDPEVATTVDVTRSPALMSVVEVIAELPNGTDLATTVPAPDNGEPEAEKPDGVKPTEAGIKVELPDPAPPDVEVTRRPANGDTGGETVEGETTLKLTTADSEFLRDFDRAVTLQRAGEYAKALEYYQRYLDRRPGHASSYNNMGVIYQKQRNYEKAIECYSRAIAAEPANYQTLNNLASCCIAEKRYENAVEALQQSIKLSEDNFPALVNLGVAQTALGNYEGAEKTLLKASRLYPDEAQTLLNLANLYRLLDQSDDAAQYYRKFLDKSDGRYAAHEAQVRKLLETM